MNPCAHITDHPNYVELLEDKEVYAERRQAEKEKKEAEKKRRREEDPDADADWFMIGSIETLTQNIVKVTNIRDKNRIQAKIDAMKEEIRAERRAEKRAERENHPRVRRKVWKYDYVVYNNKKSLRECLELPATGNAHVIRGKYINKYSFLETINNTRNFIASLKL